MTKFNDESLTASAKTLRMSTVLAHPCPHNVYNFIYICAFCSYLAASLHRIKQWALKTPFYQETMEENKPREHKLLEYQKRVLEHMHGEPHPRKPRAAGAW